MMTQLTATVIDHLAGSLRLGKFIRVTMRVRPRQYAKCESQVQDFAPCSSSLMIFAYGLFIVAVSYKNIEKVQKHNCEVT